jgi:deoxyribonuclease-4
MGKLLFGTAGVPHSSRGTDSISGIERIRELSLDAMELEFVRGVHMGRETARSVAKAAGENGVALRVHAPYFINLNSDEKKKVEASKKRIWDSLAIGEECGAEIVTFHPAYFGKRPKEECMPAVEEALAELLERMEKEGMQIRLAPETTGKHSAFGSLGETIELCRRLPKLQPMIDFAHLHARRNGCLKSKKDFVEVLGEIPPKYCRKLQMHVSGIRYNEKGEQNHLNIRESDFPYKELLKALKEKGVSGTIICESPNLEGDAMLLKQTWQGLGK